MDKGDQRFARAFPLIVDHVFLKLFAKLSLTISGRRALDGQDDALRFEPKVGPIAGSITRRSALGANIVKIDRQESAQQIFQVAFIGDLKRRPIAMSRS